MVAQEVAKRTMVWASSAGAMTSACTLRLKAAKWMGDVSWGCYDADRVTYSPNPKNRYVSLVSYHDDVAAIAPDGTLTAKKPGEAMVLAMDAKLDKEIFPVVVI